MHFTMAGTGVRPVTAPRHYWYVLPCRRWTTMLHPTHWMIATCLYIQQKLHQLRMICQFTELINGRSNMLSWQKREGQHSPDELMHGTILTIGSSQSQFLHFPPHYLRPVECASPDGHTFKHTSQCLPDTCSIRKITYSLSAKPAFHRSAVYLIVIHAKNTQVYVDIYLDVSCNFNMLSYSYIYLYQQQLPVPNTCVSDINFCYSSVSESLYLTVLLVVSVQQLSLIHI